ncbi:MAG: flagellar assembly protein FliH [Halocynthiibacter sp.]|jgi:flagellar biosynthesis/type III secretory pathway protein FliH
MMTSLFPLEDFGSQSARRAKAAAAQDAPRGPSPQEIDAQRKAAYEQGYQAGWDDANTAQADDKGRIGADFARNLQDLGFTFHEARTHVMRAMEPLLAEIVGKVLPNLVSDTIGQTIIEELLPLAEMASDTPIEVVIAPASRAALEGLLQASTSVPLEIIDEPSLAEGQVYLRLGKLERQIDMTSAVDKIGDAIRAVYALNEKAAENG